MLSAEGCRCRQRRMLEKMEENRWDFFLSGNFKTAFYFTGALGSASSPMVFLLRQDGQATLIADVPAVASDALIPLETYSLRRSINFPVRDAADLVSGLLGRSPGGSRCAVEGEGCPWLFGQAVERAVPDIQLFDASGTLWGLRKHKEQDEVQSIGESLKYCAVAYRAAREAIEPGLTEVDVYNAMYQAVVQEAGTTISFAGDFACGERVIGGGGPPTQRALEPGDLYVLDICPTVNLYFGDTTRTFAVGEPTSLQLKAWEIVLQAVRMAEQMIVPGVRARDVYQEIKAFLDGHPMTEKSFLHHLGHGIGHDGHESPRLIPGSNDVFEEGDVLTIEPGVYTKALRGGIRLEDNYVLRASGLEDLFDFPWEL